MNPQNCKTYCLKSCEWYLCSTAIEKLRHSETPCSMINLFDTGTSKCTNQVCWCDKHKIDISDNSIASLNAREFFDHGHFRIFSSMMSRVPLLDPHPKIALEI